MPLEQLFSLSNPVFASYAFYGTVVTLKLLGMAPLTSLKRFAHNVFANPEDTKAFGGKKPIYDNDSVERVRRNHLNDLENIPAFLFLGLLYVTTQPNPATALWHFRVFAISRILHTISYQLAVPQPARALAFGVGIATCVSMAVQILMATK
jgi:uncharacterized MAPEG superfamily protein